MDKSYKDEDHYDLEKTYLEDKVFNPKNYSPLSGILATLKSKEIYLFSAIGTFIFFLISILFGVPQNIFVYVFIFIFSVAILYVRRAIAFALDRFMRSRK